MHADEERHDWILQVVCDDRLNPHRKEADMDLQDLYGGLRGGGPRNRRDFLKLGGIAGLAALQPWKAMQLLGVTNWEDAKARLAGWDLSAEAVVAMPSGKAIWNARLNTDQPDLYS